MIQEITPLSVCLPPGSLEALRKKAKRIQRKFLKLDGQREKLTTVHDLVARCLGYRSYSDMHRWSDETRWPVLDEPEALRKGRQRMRELQCLSEAFPHVARDSVERLADQLALANWEVIEQSYHDKILGWKPWAQSQSFTHEPSRDTLSPYRHRRGDKIAGSDGERLATAPGRKNAIESDGSPAALPPTTSAEGPPPVEACLEGRLRVGAPGIRAPLAPEREAQSARKPAVRKHARDDAWSTSADALPESPAHGPADLREDFSAPADWFVARRGARSPVFDQFCGTSSPEHNARTNRSTPGYGTKRTSDRSRAQVRSDRAAVPALVDPLLGVPLPPPVDTANWKTPEPPLIFMPPTMWFASAKAKALCDIDLRISPAVAHALTARLFGFIDWFDLDAQFKPGKRGRFDDELPPEIRRVLHRWQATVLQHCLGLARVEAVELRVDWHPTAETLSYARTEQKPAHELARALAWSERRPSAKRTLRLPKSSAVEIPCSGQDSTAD